MSFDLGNVSDLFRQAFGIAFNPATPPPIASLEAAAGVNLYKVTGVQPDPAESAAFKTWMGTPWMFPLMFKGTSMARYYGSNGRIETRRTDDFTLPPATIADFTQEKALVETELPGGYGEVTEQYSFRPWEIRIRGLALNEGPNGRTAEEIKKKLLEFNGLIEPIGVLGSDFTEKDVYSIIIKRITFRRLEGRPNVIPFEIEAKSESPLELEWSYD